MEAVIRIGVPTHDGGIRQECVLGLLDAQRTWRVQVDIVQGSFLPRSRDLIVDRFASDGAATHLLCVDADMDWRAEHLGALLELEVDFAFGRYVGKREGAPLMASRFIGAGRSPSGVEVEEYERCGAGFLLLSRACIETMRDAYGPSESYVDPAGRPLIGLWQTSGRVEFDGRMVAEGEDYAFCRRWRSLGGQIFTRRDVRLGHVGSHVWR